LIDNWTNFIDSKPYPGVYLFIGQEEYLVDKIIEHIRLEYKTKFSVENYFIARQNNLSDALKKGIQRSLFNSSKKILRIEIARDFSMKRKSDVDDFLEILPRINNFILLYGKSLYSKSKFVSFCLKNDIKVYYVYPLKDKDKLYFISRILKDKQLKVSSNILKKIVHKGPDELFLLESELKKLFAFLGNRKEVKEEDINDVFCLDKEEEISRMLDNLENNKVKKILRNLFKYYNPVYLWAAITNHFLTIFWLRVYIDAEYNSRSLEKKFRLYYKKKNLINKAKQYNDNKLRSIIFKIHELDKEMKYSSKNNEYLIESFLDFLQKQV